MAVPAVDSPDGEVVGADMVGGPLIGPVSVRKFGEGKT